MKKSTLITLGILTFSLCSVMGPVSAFPMPDTLNQIAASESVAQISLLTQQRRNILLTVGVVIFVVIIVAITFFIMRLNKELSSLKKHYEQNNKNFDRAIVQLKQSITTQKLSQNQSHQNEFKNSKDIEQRLKNLESELSLLRSQVTSFQVTPTPQQTNYQEPWQSSVSQLPETPDNSSSSNIDQLVNLYNQNIRELIQKGVKVNVTPESVRRISTSLGIEIIDFVEQSRLGTFVAISDNSLDQTYLFPVYPMHQAFEFQREVIQACYEIPNHLRDNSEGAQLHQPALVQQLESGKWRLSKRGKIGSSKEPT